VRPTIFTGGLPPDESGVRTMLIPDDNILTAPKALCAPELIGIDIWDTGFDIRCLSCSGNFFVFHQGANLIAKFARAEFSVGHRTTFCILVVNVSERFVQEAACGNIASGPGN
jgi:hypothetical protein